MQIGSTAERRTADFFISTASQYVGTVILPPFIAWLFGYGAATAFVLCLALAGTCAYSVARRVHRRTHAALIGAAIVSAMLIAAVLSPFRTTGRAAGSRAAEDDARHYALAPIIQTAAGFARVPVERRRDCWDHVGQRIIDAFDRHTGLGPRIRLEIYVPDASRSHLTVFPGSHWGFTPAINERRFDIRASARKEDRGVAGAVFVSGQPILEADVQCISNDRDYAFRRFHDGAPINGETQSLMAVAVFRSNLMGSAGDRTPIGVLCVSSAEVARFSAKDLDYLELLAALLSPMLEDSTQQAET